MLWHTNSSSPTCSASMWAGVRKSARRTARRGPPPSGGMGGIRWWDWFGACSCGSWTGRVLVVHARARGHGVFHSLERVHQPAQPGRAGAQMDLFLTPEETAPPLELVALRSHLKVHEITEDTTPRASARRPGRSRARPLRKCHPRFAAARETAQPGLCRTTRQARRRQRGSPRVGRKIAGPRPGQTDCRGTARWSWRTRIRWCGCTSRRGCGPMNRSRRGGKP